MKLKRVRQAILQGWRVGDLLRDGSVNLPQCATAAVDYLIVVTSRQLNVGFGDNFKQMFGDDVFERLNPDVVSSAPTDEQILRLPPCHIFVLSIEEFERLVSGVKAGDLNLVSLLEEVAVAITEPGGKRMFFHQMLDGKDRADWPKSRLMSEACDRVTDDVLSHLQDQEAVETLREARS
ncbi:hypothetical protein [Roseateles noduli]|uniref:hypothetical protein n=1 Tax=Roseateles noduli TaxID=2052484 RepID=UPI003D655E80